MQAARKYVIALCGINAPKKSICALQKEIFTNPNTPQRPLAIPVEQSSKATVPEMGGQMEVMGLPMSSLICVCFHYGLYVDTPLAVHCRGTVLMVKKWGIEHWLNKLVAISFSKCSRGNSNENSSET